MAGFNAQPVDLNTRGIDGPPQMRAAEGRQLTSQEPIQPTIGVGVETMISIGSRGSASSDIAGPPSMAVCRVSRTGPAHCGFLLSLGFSVWLADCFGGFRLGRFGFQALSSPVPTFRPADFSYEASFRRLFVVRLLLGRSRSSKSGGSAGSLSGNPLGFRPGMPGPPRRRPKP